MSNDTLQKDFCNACPYSCSGNRHHNPSHFGALGCAYLETDEAKADEWTIVRNIGNGAYSNPVRVVAFNVAEGWSRDVSREIAEAVFELGRRENYFRQPARDFVERILGIALFPTR